MSIDIVEKTDPERMKGMQKLYIALITSLKQKALSFEDVQHILSDFNLPLLESKENITEMEIDLMMAKYSYYLSHYAYFNLNRMENRVGRLNYIAPFHTENEKLKNE